MPRRRSRPRSRRAPAFDLDQIDFDWIMAPIDWAVAAFAALKTALFGAWKAGLSALRRDPWARAFVVIFVLAAVARLWPPDWYNHGTFHPDERWIFDKTAELSYPEEPGRTDAAGLQYGSLPFYVVAAAKDVVTHVFPIGSYDASIVCGRRLTGLVDLATVLGTYLLAAECVGGLAAFLAALAVAASPLHIQLAHFFTVDPWLACFAVFTLWAAARLARRPSLPKAAVAGALYAAALASKSGGLPLVLPILVALFWPALEPGLEPKIRTRRFKDALLRVGAAAGTTLAAFFVFEPWAFLDFSKFIANQTAQRGILVTGSPDGTPFVRQYWDTGALFHLKNIVFFYLGFPTGLIALLAVPGAAVLAALGAVKAWAPADTAPARRISAHPKGAPAPSRDAWERVFPLILLLAWALPYFAIVGFSFAKFARYMLPLIPALAVLMALVLDWMLAQRRRLGLILAGTVALFSLGYGSGYFLTYLRPHPWYAASAWTYANIPQTVPDASAPGGYRTTRILNEDWGDDLPVNVNGRSNTYANLKGQPGQVNIVEWDSADKLNRFCASLSQADVIFLADPRAYGTYLRIPKRFPLTHAYYTLLFSDPKRLGFELAHETSNPFTLFGLIPIPDSRIPSVPRWLWADESFTLYDRPHAYIFRRTTPLAPEAVKAALMDEVHALGLSDAFLGGRNPSDLQAQADGIPGTGGAGLAPGATPALPQSAVNRNFGRDRGGMTALGNPVLTWWFLVSVLGWLALPLTVRLFSGFPAGGYALSRALGVFLFGWFAFTLAALLPGAMPFWQDRLWLLLAAAAAATVYGVRSRRGEVVAWIKANGREILFTEAVFAGAFAYFCLVRAFNPNIHDVVGQGYFGGGEPLGMTYLSAITRCATFPAFDPWLALANSSYYYFGYVLAGALTKLSGFPPAVTYNLCLALFFSLTILSAYGLVRAFCKRRWVALGGALMVGMAGSLWTLAYLALEMSRGALPWNALFSHGFIWDPTRFPELVSGHIFEFPYFSYLYGDLHPHNIVLGFSILLAALLLKPFLSPAAGWRAFGATKVSAGLWLAVTALLLDAQFAINTWSWPVFTALASACLLTAPWAGRKLGFWGSLKAAAWGLVFLVVAVGLPLPGWRVGAQMVPLVPGLGWMLMAAFRFFFLQNGANRIGRVWPTEWQMSSYIPLAYYLPGLAALAALGGTRLRVWGQDLSKPLGWEKLKRRSWFDKGLTLWERYFDHAPVTAIAWASFTGAILVLVLWAAFAPLQGVWAVGLSTGLACLGFFLMGGHRRGAEAFLWLMGGCFCFMVFGVEFLFVADRMNTIFKVWMNGWIFMGLIFGAGFAAAFEAPETHPVAAAPRGRMAKSKRRGNTHRTPAWLPGVVLGLGGVFAVCGLTLGAALLDAHFLATGTGTGRHFFVSFAVMGALLAALMALNAVYADSAMWRAVRRGAFLGLLGMGLLYPLGATVARIHEASGFSAPHLDGLKFMTQRDARFGYDAKDYDKHDYVLIQWLNKNATVTETVLEAPGTELYKGYNRFSIYTGLPTLLGWDYQVSQQLGERTGDTLEQRRRDAAILYGTDEGAASALLKRYHVRWIVVGSLERKLYPAAGLDKFAHMATVAAQDGTSILYRYEWDKP